MSTGGLKQGAGSPCTFKAFFPDFPRVSANVSRLHLRVEAEEHNGAAAAGGQDCRSGNEDPEAARGHGPLLLPQQSQSGSVPLFSAEPCNYTTGGPTDQKLHFVENNLAVPMSA